MNLYSNPAEDQISVAINLPQAGEFVLEITDINGKLVRSVPLNKYPGGINIVSIPVEDLSQGMYILNLISPRFTASKKFIKH